MIFQTSNVSIGNGNMKDRIGASIFESTLDDQALQFVIP